MDYPLRFMILTVIRFLVSLVNWANPAVSKCSFCLQKSVEPSKPDQSPQFLLEGYDIGDFRTCARPVFIQSLPENFDRRALDDEQK
jgi:hypothetical protein